MQYRRIINKLIYLTVTRHEISFVVELPSQLMHKPTDIYRKASMRVLVYIKSSFGKGLLHKKHRHVHIFAFSDVGYAIDKGGVKFTSISYVCDNLVTWRSKKKNAVSQNSAEVKYQTITYITYGLLWLKNLMNLVSS